MLNQLDKKIHILIFSVFLIFLSNISHAQNFLKLGNNEVKEIAIPLLTELDIHWWKYFESTKSTDELNERIKLFAEEFSKSINLIENKEGLEKKRAAIIELLKQFQKQKFIILEVETPNDIELQEAYSLQDLMKVNTEKNEIIALVNGNQTEITALNDNILMRTQEIDRYKINYFESDLLPQKLEIAVVWIDTRLKQALDEIRVKRILVKNEQLNKTIEVKVELISQASKRLVLNNKNKETDDTKSLVEKQQKIHLKIDKLNLELAQDFTDSIGSRLNNDLIRLDLVLAFIEDTKYSLIINNKRQILLLEKFINDDSIDIETVRNLILETQEVLEKASNKLAGWQKVSQDTLLASTRNTTKYSKKERQLDDKKRKKAEAILKENEELNTLLDDNAFNLNLLEMRLNEIDDSYSKMWNTVKEATINTKNTLINVIYTPLFTVNDYPITLLPLIKLVLIILLGFIISKIVAYFVGRYEKKHKLNSASNRSSLYLIHAIVRYIIIFVTMLASFSALGINLGNITLIAGALSVGIGFGLQNLVSNFVSGLTIMFDKTLSVGDYIKLEDGVTGVVKEIRARSTRINTNDNIDIIIPNSDMVTNRIINWTLKESIRRIRIPFGVAYGTDKELVKKAALEAASKVEFTLTHMHGKESNVYITEYADSCVKYTLLVWVAHYGLRRPGRMRSHYLWELDNAFTKYDIEIPFPQRDVNLKIIDQSELTKQDILE